MSKAQIQKRAALIISGVVGISALFRAVQEMVKIYQENRNLFFLIIIVFGLVLVWATSAFVYFARTKSKTHKPKYSSKKRKWALGTLIGSLFLLLIAFLFPRVRAYVAVAINGSPTICPYADVASTDDAITQWLIKREAQAVQAGKIEQIKEIFSKSALIVDYYDVNNPVEYNDPYARYETLFANAKYINPINKNIKALVLTDDTAYYISGSQGKIMWTNGKTDYYSNLDNANHWTLRKLDNGCWKIVGFDFNAAAIPFPVNVKVP